MPTALHISSLLAVNLGWGWLALWGVLGLVTAGLVVLMLTRWGHSEPLHKCVALSLLVHLMLALYAATIHIATNPPGTGTSYTTVALHGTSEPSGLDGADLEAPWEQFSTEEIPHLAEQTLERLTTTDAALALPAAAHRPAVESVAAIATSAPTVTLPPLEAPERTPAPPATAVAAVPEKTAAHLPTATPAELPRAASDQPAPDVTRMTRPDPAPTDLGPAPTTPELRPTMTAAAPPPAIDPNDRPGPAPTETTTAPTTETASNQQPTAPLANDPLVKQMLGAAGASLPKVTAGPVTPDHARPHIYDLRFSPDRAATAEQSGGSEDTEASVRAALRWLAKAQSPDGRWDADRFGAGQEPHLLGQDRRGAGAEADTGITGLALLAFLGSGQTHTQGEYQPQVARGLNYLIAMQGPRGELGGHAAVYEFMYCHGMAALALSEAYAMTGDKRLAAPVQRAVAYTVASQNRATGGWRYRAGDVGDMSQFGWQLMFLKSADLAGIPLGAGTRELMQRFLASASTGKHGGLASYRAGEQVSRTMTAEGLVCRVFLGSHNSPASLAEAADFVIEEVPGTSPANFYYWYYATLGLYQLQDSRWGRWNQALSGRLLDLQRRDGSLAGSWDPDPTWGAHGGRVYATALGALCFEVYYRYLPLHIEAAGADRTRR
ncbi:MAG: hypothetical protein JSS27_06940 [Planctomycetes bacterium]|nr:hypothetical protein [Planctomycetota bacterium]